MCVLLIIEGPEGQVVGQEVYPEDFYIRARELGWCVGEAVSFRNTDGFIVTEMDERTFIEDGEVREIHIAFPNLH